jgi:peptidyl-tRNA hydrolase, PTH1 family
MKLIAGLGNPGAEYAGTRHNVGFDVVDALAARLGAGRGRSKFQALAFDAALPAAGEDQRLVLLKPMTYMNRSGSSVQAAMAFYQLTPPDLMVVLDDMALACGRLRIRTGGSSGGHNGLVDIERALGTNQYPRLRIGIDAPPSAMAGKDYVLGRVSPAQRPLVEASVDWAVQALLTWAQNGIDAAMNQFNAGPDAV